MLSVDRHIALMNKLLAVILDCVAQVLMVEDTFTGPRLTLLDPIEEHNPTFCVSHWFKEEFARWPVGFQCSFFNSVSIFIGACAF